MTTGKALWVLALAGMIGTMGLGMPIARGEEQAKTKEAVEEPAEKSGTLVGILVEKDEGWIRVRAQEDGPSERFVPQWKGGMPKDGGGPDKEMLKKFKETPVGAKVEVKWVWAERKRALDLTVLEKPAETKQE